MTRPLTLRVEDWTLELAPEIGGAIVALQKDGQALLRPTAPEAVEAGDVRRMACYPLMPYANRINVGRFAFGGASHRLRQNFQGSEHPLHGVGWQRPWRVEEEREDRATLTLAHRPVGERAQDWPFAFEARQRFELDASGLTVVLELRNIEVREAPAGLGLHSFFPRSPGETLTFEADGAWRNGADMLPAGRVGGEAWDFHKGRALIDGLDNDFFGWRGRAALTTGGRRRTIGADPVFGTLRVYTPAGADFCAVEPASHMADAINRPDETDGRMTVLAPGERLSGSVRFNLEAAA